MPTRLTKLRSIKAVHTTARAIFAGSILAISMLTWMENWFVASILFSLYLRLS